MTHRFDVERNATDAALRRLHARCNRQAVALRTTLDRAQGQIDRLATTLEAMGQSHGFTIDMRDLLARLQRVCERELARVEVRFR